jgi:predicted tellurium resistance membrane protein TerC
MRAKPTAITELPPSPDEERRGRVIRYTIAMSIRMVCLILAVVLPDWWKVIPLIGAVTLPYVAVVIANSASRVGTARVARPGAVARRTPDRDAA